MQMHDIYFQLNEVVCGILIYFLLQYSGHSAAKGGFRIFLRTDEIKIRSEVFKAAPSKWNLL